MSARRDSAWGRKQSPMKKQILTVMIPPARVEKLSRPKKYKKKGSRLTVIASDGGPRGRYSMRKGNRKGGKIEEEPQRRGRERGVVGEGGGSAGLNTAWIWGIRKKKKKIIAEGNPKAELGGRKGEKDSNNEVLPDEDDILTSLRGITILPLTRREDGIGGSRQKRGAQCWKRKKKEGNLGNMHWSADGLPILKDWCDERAGGGRNREVT